MALADFPEISNLPNRPELPDPLVMLDGTRVASPEQWTAKRRPELKALFQHYMYGQMPPAIGAFIARVERKDEHYFGGKATKKDRGPGNDHPTVKPLHLMSYLLRLLSTPTGGVILDPFAGSGTTLEAAKRLGRPCLGVELDAHNCDIVVARLES